MLPCYWPKRVQHKEEEMVWTKEQQKAHRKILIEALRSGDYAQTRNHLKDDNGHCCMGVGCEISGLGEWQEQDTMYQCGYSTETDVMGCNHEVCEDNPLMPKIYKYVVHNNTIVGDNMDYSASMLPALVQEYYGFRSGNGAYSNGDRDDGNCLTSDNDDDIDFREIADTIAKEPFGLV